jgi:hypothetical protein
MFCVPQTPEHLTLKINPTPNTRRILTQSTMSNKYYIPDILENWKWPRVINPHFQEVKAASAAWARSFGAFSPKAQDAYDRCDFSTSGPRPLKLNPV